MADSKEHVTKVIHEGIATSYDNAGEAWRKAAHETLERLARDNQYIVSDTLIAALEEAGYGLSNYSALGGVFQKASKERLIEKTGGQRLSERSKSHSAKTVWRSRVYAPPSKEETAVKSLLMAALDFNAETVRYASMLFRAGGLDPRNHKRAVRDFKKMQDNYTARYTMIIEDLEREPTAGGKRGS